MIQNQRDAELELGAPSGQPPVSQTPSTSGAFAGSAERQFGSAAKKLAELELGAPSGQPPVSQTLSTSGAFAGSAERQLGSAAKKLAELELGAPSGQPPVSQTLSTSGAFAGSAELQLGSAAKKLAELALGAPSVPPRTSSWTRFALVQALQLPAVGLALYGMPPWSFWCAGIWGGIVCVLGTDSVGPWRNRFLRSQAIAWLVVPLLVGW